MWRGIGILSPTGIILDGWAKNGDHILNSMLIRLTTTIETIGEKEHEKKQEAQRHTEG